MMELFRFKGPRSFGLGFAVFILCVAAGLLALSIGATIARSLQLGVAGLALLPIGAIAAGAIMLFDWRNLELRYRLVGVGLFASGLIMAGIMARVLGAAPWLLG